MVVKRPTYSIDEAARRGDEIYNRAIKASVEPQHNGEIVAIDLDSGEWEVDADENAAAGRLEARLPDAQVLVIKVGSRFVRRFGAGRTSAAQ
jgi:hypothetical protein